MSVEDLNNIFFPGGHFFGIAWSTWKVIGWIGNLAFFSRFLVQWRASENRKQVVVPISFWWLSILGSFCLLSYALFKTHDSVFIFANLFNWIPYIRNLIIHKRHLAAHMECRVCLNVNPPGARFCQECGKGLPLART